MEASGLDFGGFGDHFFEILGSLAGEMLELISNFELKLRNSSLKLNLTVLPASTSKFRHDLLRQSQAEIFRRSGWAAVSPLGGFNKQKQPEAVVSENFLLIRLQAISTKK